MGYHHAGNGNLGGSITSYTPDNNEKTLYIDASYAPSLGDLLAQIEEHFGDDVDKYKLNIQAQHIQTDCIGYDRYDSSDYTDYIVITKD